MADLISPSQQPEASTSKKPAICAVCNLQPAIYACPGCSIRTCSASCSTRHKSTGDGCSGVRNKAAYVPMNQYGYMALMNDYTFLEETGRKVGEWGREIVRGGYMGGGAGGRRGRGGMRASGRGRGRGGMAGSGSGKTRSKRDILKMQLDFREIEMELLPNGMERRILNQSTWDFKNKTALLTIEFKFYPPPDLLAGSSKPPDPPFILLTHRNALQKTLLSIIQSHVAERSKSKKGDPVPSWLVPLVTPDPDVPESFTTPTCVMRTPLDPLASLDRHSDNISPRPGNILCEGYYKLDPTQQLISVLKQKNFVEFPTIEVWEDGAFHGTIVDNQGAVLPGPEEREPKRRKMSIKESRKAIAGLLDGYGSEEEEQVEERNVLDALGGYVESDDEGHVGREEFDDGLSNEDAEGETDDELEGKPENLAMLLEQLRQAGALRDPGADGPLANLADGDDERIDWGDSGGENEDYDS